MEEQTWKKIEGCLEELQNAVEERNFCDVLGYVENLNSILDLG